MHAGIALMLGLWSFSGVMIVLNAAAFLVPSGLFFEHLAKPPWHLLFVCIRTQFCSLFKVLACTKPFLVGFLGSLQVFVFVRQ